MNDKQVEIYSNITIAQEKIMIVGGGLVGIVLAGFLAKENTNAEISVYDKLPDPREVLLDEKRSINITLCERGLAPLRSIGIAEAALTECKPVKGRIYHYSGTDSKAELYGKKGESLYSVNRSRLARRLALAVSEKYPQVKLNFNHEMVEVDLPNSRATYKNLATDEIISVQANVILGADGINSRIREKLKSVINLEETRYSHSQVYKELRFPAGPQGEYLLDPTYLHLWARNEQLMIGFPNMDGSFTISLFYPSSMSIAPDHYSAHIETHFPDIFNFIKESVEESAHYPQGSLSTVRCFPWIYEGKAALIGDAAHAVFPFYGQGANSGFEDCYILAQCYRKNPGNWEAVLKNYQEQRKPNADAISFLAEEHFKTLAKKSNLEEKIAKQLYEDISFTHIPYRVARNKAEFERKINIFEVPASAEEDNFVFHDSTGLLFFRASRRNNNNPEPQQNSPQPLMNH